MSAAFANSSSTSSKRKEWMDDSCCDDEKRNQAEGDGHQGNTKTKRNAARNDAYGVGYRLPVECDHFCSTISGAIHSAKEASDALKAINFRAIKILVRRTQTSDE